MSGYDEFFKAAKLAKTKSKGRLKKTKRAPEFSLRLMIGLGVVCALLGWLAMNPEEFDNWLGKIEVGMFGQAQAKSAGAPAEKPADSSDSAKSTKDSQEAKSVGNATEDYSHLEKLRERKEALDLREKELNELEEELHRQRGEIEARLEKLEAMRREISSVLKDRVEVDQERVNKLVETYSNMKPKQAAEIIGGIDEDLAVEVLGKMKKKSAAEILNLLDKEKARALSEKYAGYRRR